MHLAARIISIVLIVSGLVFILKSVSEQFQIHHEINLKLPEDSKFEPTFWGYESWQRFRQLQQELLPGSSRPRRLRNFQIIGIVLLLVGLLSIGENWPR